MLEDFLCSTPTDHIFGSSVRRSVPFPHPFRTQSPAQGPNPLKRWRSAIGARVPYCSELVRRYFQSAGSASPRFPLKVIVSPSRCTSEGKGEEMPIFFADPTQGQIRLIPWQNYAAALPPDMTLEELRNWLWADSDEQQMAVLQAVFTRLNQQMPAAAMLPPRVRIMSMHRAKGLSSPIVFVPGLEEHIFPGPWRQPYPGLVLEAARLLYVSITRARAVCILSYAAQRRVQGPMRTTAASRFTTSLNGPICRPREWAGRARSAANQSGDRKSLKPSATPCGLKLSVPAARPSQNRPRTRKPDTHQKPAGKPSLVPTRSILICFALVDQARNNPAHSELSWAAATFGTR